MEPFLPPAVARRIALRSGLLGLALAAVPMAHGNLRLALIAFVLGAAYAGPSLIERVAERRIGRRGRFAWLPAAGWSALAAGSAWLAIMGVVAREAYLVVDPGGVRLVGLDAIDPWLFLAPLLPAWAVGVTVFHCLLRRSGALGCGVLIVLELVVGLLTLAGVLLGLFLVDGPLSLEWLAASAILALTITVGTALCALHLIVFVLIADGLAERL